MREDCAELRLVTRIQAAGAARIRSGEVRLAGHAARGYAVAGWGAVLRVWSMAAVASR